MPPFLSLSNAWRLTISGVRRGVRYLDADSTFNDTTRDSALWLLSAAADGLCQLASDRPASMRRLADLATPPLRKRREFESTLVSARPILISLAKVCLTAVLVEI